MILLNDDDDDDLIIINILHNMVISSLHFCFIIEHIPTI